MEYLMDIDDSLSAGLISEAGDAGQCGNCHALQQEVKRLQNDYAQNFGKLKQKIISTDLLIKKYKSKCEDYDNQSKKLEETTRKLELLQRQNESISMQLKASLLDTEPLKKAKKTLDAEMRLKTAETVDLKDKLLAAQSSYQQYKLLCKSSTEEAAQLKEERDDLKKRLQSLEASKPQQMTQIKELKCES